MNNQIPDSDKAVRDEVPADYDAQYDENNIQGQAFNESHQPSF